MQLSSIAAATRFCDSLDRAVSLATLVGAPLFGQVRALTLALSKGCVRIPRTHPMLRA